MSIQVIVDNEKIDNKLIEFSDGAVNVWISPEQLKSASHYVSLVVNSDNPVTAHLDIVEYALSIIREYSDVTVFVNLPYFPNARADRAFEDGMVNPLHCSLRRLESLIKDFDVHSVFLTDIHNKKALEDFPYLTDKVSVQQQEIALMNVLPRAPLLKSILEDKNSILCAPDKGAYAKTHRIAYIFDDEKNVITCHKERDPVTGWIKSVKISNTDVNGKSVIITDDICDGGMTFIKTAEALKNAGATKVYLYVTHGIFSKGLKPFEGIIDGIWCFQHVMSYVTRQELQEFNKI